MGWMTAEVRPLSTAGRPVAPGAALLVPAAGCEVVAYPGGPQDRWGEFIDEHFAVDVDQCRAIRWLRCADVLYGHRRRTWQEAVVWLGQVTAAFGSCRLVATALGGGRWAVQAGVGGSPVCVAAGSGEAAVVSCLHGWMVAGGSLDELALGACSPPRQEPTALTTEAGSPRLRLWRR